MDKPKMIKMDSQVFSPDDVSSFSFAQNMDEGKLYSLSIVLKCGLVVNSKSITMEKIIKLENCFDVLHL